MKKIIGMLCVAIAAFTFTFFTIGKEGYSQTGGKQFVSTKCKNLTTGEEWNCNNCEDGGNTCYNHSCSECSS